MNNIKVYVDVIARFNSEGVLIPLSLTWEDGEKFDIDRVTDIRQAAAMKAGGQGDRYTIWVRGRQSNGWRCQGNIEPRTEASPCGVL